MWLDDFCLLKHKVKLIPHDPSMGRLYLYLHMNNWFQGTVGCTPTNVPLSEVPIISPLPWVCMGYFIPKNPIREHQLNTMGVHCLGVHPIIVPWWFLWTLHVGKYGCFQTKGYPKMDGLQWKTLLKWMIYQFPWESVMGVPQSHEPSQFPGPLFQAWGRKGLGKGRWEPVKSTV